MSFHGIAIAVASLLRMAAGIGAGWLILSVLSVSVFAVFMRLVRKAGIIDDDDYARMGRER